MNSQQLLAGKNSSNKLLYASLLYVDLFEMNPFENFRHKIKRFIDILGSFTGLIILLPLLVVIAIAIKLTSPGPVWFRQKRIGYLGRPFKLIKFRSMVISNQKSSHQDYVQCLIDGKLTDEEKENRKRHIQTCVTPIGKFLRRYSLDELPQLINILKGDMSIVGPRPHPVYEVRSYKDWHLSRLEMKPGLTGLSKIMIRDSARNYVEAMRLDIRYIKNWTVFSDLHIILKTVRYVFERNGAD